MAFADRLQQTGVDYAFIAFFHRQAISDENPRGQCDLTTTAILLLLVYCSIAFSCLTLRQALSSPSMSTSLPARRKTTEEFSRKRIYLVFYSMKFKHVYTGQIYAILFVNHSLGRHTHGFMVTNMVSSHPTFPGERREKSIQILSWHRAFSPQTRGDL